MNDVKQTIVNALTGILTNDANHTVTRVEAGRELALLLGLYPGPEPSGDVDALAQAARAVLWEYDAAIDTGVLPRESHEAEGLAHALRTALEDMGYET